MTGDMDSVIIVGASELVFPAFRIAREDLGLKIIAIDINPKAVGMLYADKAVVVDTKDVSGAVAAAKKLSDIYKIRGVFTCGADVEVTVAAIANALSLPGIPLAVAQDCNDKIRMHKSLDSIGFTKKPRYRVIKDKDGLTDAVEYVGLPCVFKPVSNCGSRGVQRIEEENDVSDAFHLAQQFNINGDSRVIVEQSLDGSKHTVEMIAYDGQYYLLSIIDTHYISPRWPCETGLNTTQLSCDSQALVFEFSKDVAEKIGIDYGAHKVDINIDKNGEIGLIELTARLSGGFHCQYASPLAFGSNDIRAALKLAIGLPLDLDDIKHRWQKGSAVRAVFPATGRVKTIEGVDDARQLPGIADIFIWCSEGDEVGPFHNSADRVAYVISEGESTEEAIVNAERAVKDIIINVE